jgi:hypothetical protein
VGLGAGSLAAYGQPRDFLDNLWVILARRTEDLRIPGLVPNPPPQEGNIPPQLWTDDYSNIVRLLY